LGCVRENWRKKRERNPKLRRIAVAETVLGFYRAQKFVGVKEKTSEVKRQSC
jgi:hypothetical protein